MKRPDFLGESKTGFGCANTGCLMLLVLFFGVWLLAVL